MNLITLTEEQFRAILKEELIAVNKENIPQIKEKEFLTVKQLSQYIHLSIPAIYNRVAENTIPNIHIGSKILFEKAVINEWLYSKK